MKNHYFTYLTFSLKSDTMVIVCEHKSTSAKHAVKIIRLERDVPLSHSELQRLER